MIDFWQTWNLERRMFECLGPGRFGRNLEAERNTRRRFAIRWAILEVLTGKQILITPAKGQDVEQLRRETLEIMGELRDFPPMPQVLRDNLAELIGEMRKSTDHPEAVGETPPHRGGGG